MEERPEVRSVTPSHIFHQLFVDFKRCLLQEKRQVLVKQQTGQIRIFRLQIQLIIHSPVFKEGKPRRTNGDV
jgi:hypothetical protein